MVASVEYSSSEKSVRRKTVSKGDGAVVQLHKGHEERIHSARLLSPHHTNERVATSPFYKFYESVHR